MGFIKLTLYLVFALGVLGEVKVSFYGLKEYFWEFPCCNMTWGMPGAIGLARLWAAGTAPTVAVTQGWPWVDSDQ